MLKKNKPILIQVILILFGFLYSIPIYAEESSYALDAPCQEFGNYSNLEEIKKAKLKDDPSKIWVKTVKGERISVPATTAYDAIQHSDEKSFREFMKTYESICGKGSKPPFYNSIRFAAEVELKNCVEKSKKFRKSPVMRTSFWKSKAEQLSITICYDTRNAIAGNTSLPDPPMDPKCPDFGILTLKKGDLDKFKLKNDSQKIWVRTSNGDNIAVRDDMATEAFKISNDEGLFYHYVNFAIVCGEKIPPYFDIIPYLEEDSATGCIRYADKNNPRAEAECYEKANEIFLKDKLRKK
ncbi:hypothetical protein LEP1GSC165_1524 [Leptospira santarosai str. CBC523]|uniref:hypothetical protein n=1 Tax=Leptospira santarosai TaxID=28183 RepID=UPI0002BF6114|nr:hypothetical protein [Leptospira santarosai]EMO13543.1 hypothetical protein LEP1GSC165_1524 [Leptospira santarosai str. CBC523]